VPLVKKRKQPSASTSHKGEWRSSTNEEKEQEKLVIEAKKKKKQPEAETQEISMHQGEKREKRKKKKHDAKTKEIPEQPQAEKKDEKKAHATIMREESAVKKTKVHKAFKIHSSGDSDIASGLKENPTPEKEILVEKDQITNAERNDNSGPKGNPLPDKEPLVEGD
jgi:hypothetical protein